MSDVVPSDRFSMLPERYQRRAREIATRVGEIDALIRPAGKEAVRDAVIRLRCQLRPQPDTAAKDMASEFVTACADLPEWSISEAANDFLAGRVENHTGQFMPTCAEFAKRAREIIRPFLVERASLRSEAEKLVERAADDARRHRIEMERQDPAVRARVAKLHMDAIAGLPKRRALTHIGLRDDQQKRLDAYKVKREPQPSKLLETRIVHRKASGE